MSNSRKEEIMKKIKEDLLKLSKEEFEAKLKEHKKSDWYHILMYANDPNYKISEEEE